nr:retrovirus-related Pol polyprotein from transposon TNT 1-94 [Ipomoea batatas]
MEKSAGFVDDCYPGHICRLKKAIYGLKQAPRAWYLELSTFLIFYGFHKSLADNSLFIYRVDSVIVYFLVYVGDIVLTSNNADFLDKFIGHLAARFSLKDFGLLHHFLGVKVIPTYDGLFLSQSRYILDILEQFSMTGAKEFREVPNLWMPSYTDKPLDVSNILAGFTRLDIAFAVNKLAQHMQSPTVVHWQAVKCILRYLKGTLYYGLFLRSGVSFSISAFSNSDWGGVNDNGRSTTTYVIYFGANVVSWKSSKQRSVCRSSTEAEFRALANSAAKLLWLQNLLFELGILVRKSPVLSTLLRWCQRRVVKVGGVREAPRQRQWWPPVPPSSSGEGNAATSEPCGRQQRSSPSVKARAELINGTGQSVTLFRSAKQQQQRRV